MKKRRETEQRNEKRNGFPSIWERPPYPIEMLITFGLSIAAAMAFEYLPTHHHSSTAVETISRPTCGAILRTIAEPALRPLPGMPEHLQLRY